VEKTGFASRREGLAAALRANLKRRKEAARSANKSRSAASPLERKDKADAAKERT
jgi:hypothetical protein